MRRAALAAAVALAACRPGAAPRPIPAAVDEVVRGTVAETHEAALRAFTDEGLPLRPNNAARGVVETEYFDMGAVRPRDAQDYPATERMVRLRATASNDSLGRGTRLAIQAMYAPFGGGDELTRRNERAVPKDHPAAAFARELAERIRGRVGGIDG